jgi:hypothetical protein
MKYLLFFSSLFFTCTGQLTAQDSNFTYLKTVKEEIARFTVDNLDNIYLVNNDGRIKKMNAAGDSVAVFNDVRRYGPLYSIDASNPLKLLLYYKDFGTIVVLDRFLNLRNTIDLRRHNILQVTALGQSYDNKIWLYDEVENKLKKIDEDGRLLSETSDFRQLFGEAPAPKQVMDQEGFVYLYDPEKAVYVFDYYGALKNQLPFKHWAHFKVLGRFVFGLEKDTLHRYQLSTLDLVESKLPQSLQAALQINFTASRLYALKKEGLEIYSFR